MFTVHYKDGKVYLVFASDGCAEDFFYSFHNPSQNATLTIFNNKWALEYVPIIDTAQAHADALAVGKKWDAHQDHVHPVGANA